MRIVLGILFQRMNSFVKKKKKLGVPTQISLNSGNL